MKMKIKVSKPRNHVILASIKYGHNAGPMKGNKYDRKVKHKKSYEVKTTGE